MDDTIAATVCMTTTGRNKAYTASNVSVTCVHVYVLQRKYIVMCNNNTDCYNAWHMYRGI